MINNIDKLSTQHIKALIDLRNAEFTRLNRDRYELVDDIYALQYEMDRRSEAGKTASKFQQHLIHSEVTCN